MKIKRLLSLNKEEENIAFVPTQNHFKLENTLTFDKVVLNLASGQIRDICGTEDHTTMTNEELTVERQRGWESFTKVSTYSVIAIMIVLGLMAATLV
ncbi:hypothetical protein WH96_13500 [Kiloniella spongiae]|uniref:Uncharacterized protein n=1 Tax=Kiloniella spongiae TaxID=1489064 RepID=A0A0H2MU17_9PROT|nr:hypothetical protein [Kiloniella spongiae]KLN60195.1 hypothetical protein WH96_13500 [Kiloniella spongiae]